MNKLIQSKFDCLLGHLTTEKQKQAYKSLLSAVHSETSKLENKIERLSKNIVIYSDIPVFTCESTSCITRITFVPNERVTIKIPSNIKSEQIKQDYIKIAEFVKDNYKGVKSIRSSICWKNELGYCLSFQTTKGKNRKNYQIKYKNGEFLGNFNDSTN